MFYKFVLSRIWTWTDAPQKLGKGFILQFIAFNLAALASIMMRIIVFAILDKFGVFYLINVFLGIGMASAVSFTLYDKLVFIGALNKKET